MRPQVADAVDAELALLAARGVQRVLEAVHRDLAEDRRDLALERLGEQREARLGVRRRVEQAAEHELLAEHARRLGERQRRALLEEALRPRQRRVHAVAELVGEGQDVAAARGVVEQHVRVDGGDGVRAERAAALVRAHGRVDPAVVVELRRRGRRARRENER